MADIDLQSLGMRLGEAITPTPSNAPQVRYGTIATVNSDGTLDVTIDGTTLRGVCATTGCVGAAEGMRCVVLRQGPLATVVGLIASTDLGDVTLPDGNATFANGGYILGTDPDGNQVYAFSPCNAYGNLIIGNASNPGNVNIYSGNRINLYSSGVVFTGDISTNVASNFMTVDTTKFTVSTCGLVKWGRLVTLYINGFTAAAISVAADGNITDVTIATLKADYRPVSQMSLVANGNGAAGQARLIVQTGGGVTLTAFARTGSTYTIAAGSGMAFGVTYLVA